MSKITLTFVGFMYDKKATQKKRLREEKQGSRYCRFI
jgi:hypothetical protein